MRVYRQALYLSYYMEEMYLNKDSRVAVSVLSPCISF